MYKTRITKEKHNNDYEKDLKKDVESIENNDEIKII